MQDFWPKVGHSMMATSNPQQTLRIQWSKNYFDDYKKLASDYAMCGTVVFTEVISSGHDNIKSDAWFLSGIYLLRHALELGLKALICRISQTTPDIQNAFLSCQHNLKTLYDTYCASSEQYLTADEHSWLDKYLTSLETVDQKSDIFRFPFDDIFLHQYRNKFLDNVDVANNLLQAFSLVEKCINCGAVPDDSEFDSSLVPEFFIFATHGIGNCSLWQPISDDGFFMKIEGYNDVAQFIYEECSNIPLANKIFPLFFVLRNSIELGLKRLFYTRVEHGLCSKIFYAKRNSHRVKKDLWKHVRPVIEHYANATGEDLSIIPLVESQLAELESIDKNGDVFRYPTSYSLEYRIHDVVFDVANVYEFMQGIIQFLNGCGAMLENIADFESEMRYEYGFE